MCDYSLHTFPNRLAVDGEELVVHRFGGASLGLASPADFRPSITANQCAAPAKFWDRVSQWWSLQCENWRTEQRVPAVCIPPGANLILRDIPKSLQRELAVGEVEEVKFIETSADVNTYRDGVRFKNSRQVLLQALHEGQRVTVLAISPAEVEAPFFLEERSNG